MTIIINISVLSAIWIFTKNMFANGLGYDFVASARRFLFL